MDYSELLGPVVRAVQEIDTKQQGLGKGQQDLNKTIVEQEKAINGLRSENDLLKSELCRKDGLYSWCKK